MNCSFNWWPGASAGLDPELEEQLRYEAADAAYQIDRDDAVLNASQPQPMGLLKNYLTDLICRCAPDNGFAQDAIEYAITSGLVTLSYSRGKDIHAIMARYDAIILHYRSRKEHQQQPFELAA